MSKHLKYHFEAEKGWINDPNGLIWFNGKYHAFFQHNPYGINWDTMHWGHAVSDDLVHWDELPIALYPDMPYEKSQSGGGCFSGSAVEKDGILWFFYTSVSDELGQTQSLAFTHDCKTFEKYPGNPIIPRYPEDGCPEFRDPKVTKIGKFYYMVVGSGKDGIGKVLLYRSEDLINWEYKGVLFEDQAYGPNIECPDFFPLDDKYVLMFSIMGKATHSTMFIVGDFENERFTPISRQQPEAGPHFYAPQTFLDPLGRRIIIGWCNKKHEEGTERTGCFNIPRELRLNNGKLSSYPVDHAQLHLTASDKLVHISSNEVVIDTHGKYDLSFKGTVKNVSILRDHNLIEVFVNNGEVSFSYCDL
ncbi:MAG: glycoside hydrolase family 32 protein [Ruminococcaceae bacterium]|nr:glycoside hydrolase family 32 protein [Oscillospiraceae bacterium]